MEEKPGLGGSRSYRGGHTVSLASPSGKGSDGAQDLTVLLKWRTHQCLVWGSEEGFSSTSNTHSSSTLLEWL